MFGRATDDSVITLDSRRRAAGSECFATLDGHWSALADGRIMPHRNDIDPRALEPILDRCFLLEQFAPGMARFRFAGQNVADLMAMDLRGMPFSALFAADAREAVEDTLTAVFAEPARCELVVQSQRRGLRGRAAGQILILPLRDNAGEVTRAIGCLSLGGTRITAPQRLDVVGQDRRTLVGFGTRPATPRPVETDSVFDAADAARARIRQRRDMRAMLRVISND